MRDTAKHRHAKQCSCVWLHLWVLAYYRRLGIKCVKCRLAIAGQKAHISVNWSCSAILTSSLTHPTDTHIAVQYVFSHTQCTTQNSPNTEYVNVAVEMNNVHTDL